MTLTIVKNGTRDFDHVTEFKSLSIGYYNMILDNTLQTVVIKMPNGSQFPNDAIGVNNVFFQDNTDAGVIEPFASTEALKERLIEVDYNGLVEPSDGGGGTVLSVNNEFPDELGDINLTTQNISDSSNKRYVTDAQLTTVGNTSGTNTGDQDLSGLMVKANNLSDLTNTSSARTNLGLGTLATQNGTFTNKADLASPAFTGTPTAPTASPNTNNTQLATTAYVDAGLQPVYRNTEPTTAVTGTTTETILQSVLVAGGKCQIGDMLEMWTRTTKTGTAGIATIRFRVNTTNSLSGAVLIGTTPYAVSGTLSQEGYRFLSFIGVY